MGFHTWLLVRNMTTIEYMAARSQREAAKAVSEIEVGKPQEALASYPYDIGTYSNLCSVLGDNPLLWLLPVGGPSGDGLSFPLRPVVAIEREKLQLQHPVLLVGLHKGNGLRPQLHGGSKQPAAPEDDSTTAETDTSSVGRPASATTAAAAAEAEAEAEADAEPGTEPLVRAATQVGKGAVMVAASSNAGSAAPTDFQETCNSSACTEMQEISDEDVLHADAGSRKRSTGEHVGRGSRGSRRGTLSTPALVESGKSWVSCPAEFFQDLGAGFSGLGDALCESTYEACTRFACLAAPPEKETKAQRPSWQRNGSRAVQATDAASGFNGGLRPSQKKATKK